MAQVCSDIFTKLTTLLNKENFHKLCVCILWELQITPFWELNMALRVGTNTLETPRIWHPMVSFCWDLITPGTSSLVEQEHTTASHSIPSLMWRLWRLAFFGSAFLHEDGPTLENTKLRIHFNHWILCFIIFKHNSSLLLQYYLLHCIYI